MLNQPAVKNRNLAMKINAVMRSFTVKMLAAVAMLYVAAGCSTNEAQFPKPLEYYIGNAQPLEGERLPAEYMTKYSFGCFYTPDGFIGEMELENNKLIHLADLEAGEVIRSAVSRGRGPNCNYIFSVCKLQIKFDRRFRKKKKFTFIQ